MFDVWSFFFSPQSSLSSNWSRGGSAPLLDEDTTKLMEGAREKLMRAVMKQVGPIEFCTSSTYILWSQISWASFIDLSGRIRSRSYLPHQRNLSYAFPFQCPLNYSYSECNSNERYVTCGGCEGSCSNPNPVSLPPPPFHSLHLSQSCPSGCRPSRCECLPGFVRFSSVCIPSRDCPNQPTRPSRPPGGPWPPSPPGSQSEIYLSSEVKILVQTVVRVKNGMNVGHYARRAVLILLRLVINQSHIL